MPTLGNELKRRRKERGMTQAQVCLACGVTKRMLIQMERGCNPRLDDLLVVVAYIGIPLGEAIRHPHRDTPWVARRT